MRQNLQYIVSVHSFFNRISKHGTISLPSRQLDDQLTFTFSWEIQQEQRHTAWRKQCVWCLLPQEMRLSARIHFTESGWKYYAANFHKHSNLSHFKHSLAQPSPHRSTSRANLRKQRKQEQKSVRSAKGRKGKQRPLPTFLFASYYQN